MYTNWAIWLQFVQEIKCVSHSSFFAQLPIGPTLKNKKRLKEIKGVALTKKKKNNPPPPPITYDPLSYTYWTYN